MGTGLLSATGYDPKRLEDVLTDLRAAMRVEFGQGMELGADTPEGKLVGILGAELTQLWERSEAIYQAAYPAGASGVNLDRLSEITGVNRIDASRSTGTAYLRGTGATVPIDSLISVVDADDQFRTTAAATIPASGAIPLSAGTADIAITSITRVSTVASVTTTAPHGLLAGSVVTISGANEAEYNVTAVIENIGGSTFDYNMVGDPGGSATGTVVYQDVGLGADHIVLGTITARSTAAHGLTTGDFAFVHDATETNYNTVASVIVLDATHFTYSPLLAVTVPVATGSFAASGATSVAVESVNTGAIQALAGTLTVIDNPIGGWDAVSNAIAVTLGVVEETDAAFRTRRLAAFQGLGNATGSAITGDLLTVDNVLTASVFENDTGVTVSGRPPHSIECLVDGGTDADIAQAIWDSKAGGINTTGGESDIAVDVQGDNQTVFFSRPSNIDIFLDVTLTVDSEYPTAGDAQVESLILEFATTYLIGQDVVVFPYLLGSFDEVPGVLDVVIDIGIAPAPSGDANITIAETERARFTAVNTTVTS